MKVTIVVGGRWHAFDLASNLQKSGELHRLITTYPKFKTRQWGIPDEKVVSLPLSLIIEKILHKVGQEALTAKFQYFLHDIFGKAVVNHLDGSDVIHGWSSFSLPSIKWAKDKRIPFLLERSSSHMLVQSQLLREEYSRLGLTWAETHPKIIQQELEEYELADCVAVPSLFVKNSFLTQNFSEKKLFHNIFGSNTECFVPGHKQDNIFRIIYAGSLTVRKGVHYLLEAFKQANLPNSELYLVGGVSNSAKSILGEFNEKIKFIGHVPQNSLVNYYQNSSVFVMASIEEGMAMVQLQALSCGLPLICTTNTGGEDLLRLSGEPKQLKNEIQEYPAGYLVPVRDSQAIAECLQFLAEDPILLRSKQESALVLRNSDLSWINYSERVVQFYKILMNNRSNQEKNTKLC